MHIRIGFCKAKVMLKQQRFNRIHYNNDAASTFYLVVGTGTRTRTVASW